MQDPVGLAVYLLRDTGSWDRAHIEQVLSAGTETTVNLPASIPTHLLVLHRVGG
ncbi:MAG: hypothetical protein R3E12_03405 [Candidatus Eisenbacteria bacterium]